MHRRRSIPLLLVAGMMGFVPAPVASAAPVCSLTGTDQDDVLVGTEVDDVICPLGGDDIVDGRGGTDLIFGDVGADQLVGGDGADYLDGGPDGGSLDGGTGPDACVNGTPVSCYPPGSSDPHDTRGYLDVTAVVTAFGTEAEWQISTRKGWSVRRLWDEGFFVVQVDTRGDPGADYHAVVGSNGRRLRGTLFAVLTGRDRARGSVSVGRPNQRTVLIRIPLARLGLDPARAYYRWSLTTVLVDGPCRRACTDLFTDEGALPQPVP
ncbi:MAG TPA: calcium-binding protein [Actinomycetota bacterium]|nr:calcium-binding protein [Actinomycetota bacterium]